MVRGCPLRAAGNGTLHGNSGARIPLDPLPVFELVEIVIDTVFRISVEVVVGVRDLTVWGVEPEIPGWRLAGGFDLTRYSPRCLKIFLKKLAGRTRTAD